MVMREREEWNEAKPKGMLNVFSIYIFSIRNEVGSRICTCKTERTLQISGKCVQFTQSCLRTPLSNLRTETRQKNQRNEASRPLKELSVVSTENMEKSPCNMSLLHCCQNHNLFMK